MNWHILIKQSFTTPKQKKLQKQKVEDELTHFDKTKLHHTETKVTNSMVEEEKPKEIQTEGK